MQHRHAALELGLYLRIARRREADPPELIVLMLPSGNGLEKNDADNDRKREQGPHKVRATMIGRPPDDVNRVHLTF
jgi:hypothetical protein